VKTSPSIQHISAITLAVRDMARSIAFYETLGFEVFYVGAQKPAIPPALVPSTGAACEGSCDGGVPRLRPVGHAEAAAEAPARHPPATLRERCQQHAAVVGDEGARSCLILALAGCLAAAASPTDITGRWTAETLLGPSGSETKLPTTFTFKVEGDKLNGTVCIPTETSVQAIDLQAGGHWFEPSTAHYPSPFCFNFSPCHRGT